MLFNISKQKSSAFIKLFVTLAIIFVPTFLNMLSLEASVNLMFVISSVVFLMHIKANERLNISLGHIIYMAIIAFGVLSLIWVNNRSGQFTYIFAVALTGIFGSVFKEYFSESNDNSFKRRVAYLFSISGTICAFYNFIYWITEIVPVAGNTPFCKGLGTEDFLGIFCIVSLFCTLSLFKGNSKLRKVFFFVSGGLQVFCFIMAKSTVAWIFAVAFSALLFLRKRSENKNSSRYFMQMIAIVFAYIVALLIILFNSENGKIFGDVCSYAGSNLFGAGGGFLSGSGTFTESSALQRYGVGLLPFLFASSGLLGIIACMLFVVRSVLFFLKNKTMESALGLVAVISLLFLPFGNCIGNVLLVIGINTYNEYCFNSGSALELNKKQLKNITTVGAILVILISSATVLSLIEMNVNSAYKSKDYSKAYDLSKIVTSIDAFDSDCNKIAAASIRNDKFLLANKKSEALALINDAINNDCDNLDNYEEKAKIYYACGEYESAAAQYRIIVSKTVVKDKYNLALADVLFKIVEENEKGSSETKRAYEEIVEIAQLSEDLEVKEKIMDVADKALVYTKGELSSEGEIVEE